MNDETTPQDDAAMSPASTGSAADRITGYLCSGGLFNPEMAIHDRVRDLLIAARDEIARPRLTDAEREAVRQSYTMLQLAGSQHHADAIWGLLERLK